MHSVELNASSSWRYARTLGSVLLLVLASFGARAEAQTSGAKPFRLKLGSSFVGGAFAVQGSYDFMPAKTPRGWTVAGFIDYTGGSILGESWSLIGAGAEGRIPFSDTTKGDYFFGALGAGVYRAQAGSIYSGYGASGFLLRGYVGYEIKRTYLVEIGVLDTSWVRVGMRF